MTSLITHNSESRFIPIIVIDADPNHIADYLWETSDLLRFHEIKKDIIIADLDTVWFDPGGVFFTKIPFAEFTIGGNKFKVQYNKLGIVAEALSKCTDERFPGYMSLGMYRNNCVMSIDLHTKLAEKIKELESTAEAANAEMDQYEQMEDLEKSGVMCFKNLPREPGRKVDP